MEASSPPLQSRPALLQESNRRAREQQAEDGPAVLLLHGFPELWLSWRHQMAALAARGFRALAPDLRGYGDSSAPSEAAAYSIFHYVGDIIALLDHLQLTKVSVVGHDVGAQVAWHLCLFRPERVRAAVVLGVPYFPRHARPVTEVFASFGDGFYINQFQEPGRAESTFAGYDVATVLKKFYSIKIDNLSAPPGVEIIDFLEASPSPLPWISEEGLDQYAEKFQKSGFTGPLTSMLKSFRSLGSLVWVHWTPHQYAEKFQKSGFAGPLNYYHMVPLVIAKHLPKEEIPRLIGMFKATDNGSSGATTLAELKEGSRKCGSVFKNIEISDIIEMGRAFPLVIIEIVTGQRDYPDEDGVSSQEYTELVLKNWRHRLQNSLKSTSLEIDCQQIVRCIQIGLDCVKLDRLKRPTINQVIRMLHHEIESAVQSHPTLILGQIVDDNQVDSLRNRCKLQELELQKSTIKVQVAMTLAAEESAKAKAAKEVIKSLTAQLKDDWELGNRRARSSSDEMLTVGSRVDDSVRMDAMSLQNGEDSYMPRGTIPSPSNQVQHEWIDQYQPGIHITLLNLGDGTRDLKRIRFSRKRFEEHQAETWWIENREKVYERYNVKNSQLVSSAASAVGKNLSDGVAQRLPCDTPSSLDTSPVRPTTSSRAARWLRSLLRLACS